MRAKDSRDGYQNIDISMMSMSKVVENYVDGYIALTHPQLRGTHYLTIDNLRKSTIPMFTIMTLNQWLTHNHDQELPTVNLKPEYNQEVVLYSDAFRAGFNIDRVGRYLPVDANISNADKVDILLRKNIPDKNELYTKLIGTVNGFVHRVFPHEDGVSLAGGGVTFNNTGVNTVGVLSFANACSLRQYPITEDMITPTSSTVPLHNELLINLGVPLHNKTIMTCIGGYLYINKGVGEVVNHETGIIIVKLVKLDLLKMVMNSVGRINLDTLGIFTQNQSINYNKVRIEDVKSDICVKKYMTLPQSFVIVADVECIQTDYQELSVTGLPGVYESKIEPIYPVVNSQGLLPEYWKAKSENDWSIRLTDDVTKRRLYQSNIDANNEMVNSISQTYKWYHDDPRYLKITVTTKGK